MKSSDFIDIGSNSNRILRSLTLGPVRTFAATSTPLEACESSSGVSCGTWPSAPETPPLFVFVGCGVDLCSLTACDVRLTLRTRSLAGWFDVGMVSAPAWSSTPFDGGFEDGGFVAFEVGLDALEIGDGFVEAGELLFDLRDDSFCCSCGATGNGYGDSCSKINARAVTRIKCEASGSE